MGSLLPGWDTEPQEPPKDFHAELLEQRKSLEKDFHGVGLRPSEDGKVAGKPPTGPPQLSRKSAPSSFIIRKLEMALPDEEDDPQSPSPEDKTEKEKSRSIRRLFSRDKWWRKFSSAHLNELAKEEEKGTGAHTYKPQFDLVGNDPYTKTAAK